MNTKQSGVTVWTDEHGVTREYREVWRKAQVGELVKIVGGFGHGFNSGEIASVTYEFGCDLVRAETNSLTQAISHIDGDYVVLEPTDIIHYAGKRWREVKRKARMFDVVRDSHGTLYNVVSDRMLLVGHNPIPESIANDPEFGFVVLEPVTDDEQSTPPADERIQALERRLQAAEAEIKALTERLVILEERIGGLEHYTGAVQTKLAEAYAEEKQKQLTREQVVEMAKRDVEELKSYDDLYYITDPEDKYCDGYFVYADFVVNRDKRIVVCLLRGKDTRKVYARGIAKTHPDDVFNLWLGRAIALRRALGLDVPDYYVNAPQPTDVHVGDVVMVIGNDKRNAGGMHAFEIGTTVTVRGYRPYTCGGDDGEGWECYDGKLYQILSKRNFRIIDDSHYFGGSQPQHDAKGRVAA